MVARFHVSSIRLSSLSPAISRQIGLSLAVKYIGLLFGPVTYYRLHIDLLTYQLLEKCFYCFSGSVFGHIMYKQTDENWVIVRQTNKVGINLMERKTPISACPIRAVAGGAWFSDHVAVTTKKTRSPRSCEISHWEFIRSRCKVRWNNWNNWQIHKTRLKHQAMLIFAPSETRWPWTNTRGSPFAGSIYIWQSGVCLKF